VAARAHQVKWPGWKIHHPGSSHGSALPSPAYCFASVIVWTENKNVTISDRFICFILTVKRRWRPVFLGRQLKKVVKFFEEKSASGWPGWRIFWSRNDLAPPAPPLLTKLDELHMFVIHAVVSSGWHVVWHKLTTRCYLCVFSAYFFRLKRCETKSEVCRCGPAVEIWYMWAR